MKTFESNKCPGAIFITDGTGDFHASRTCLVFRIVNASLIPKVWNKTLAVFITKPDRSCKVAERFRPIHLTLILLKIMERIIDRHIYLQVVGCESARRTVRTDRLWSAAPTGD